MDSAALALHEIQTFQLSRQPPDAPEAVCPTRAVESGQLLQVMRNGLRPSHVKERRTDSPRGVHSVQNRSESGRRPARGGRPESESNTPVNIEDGLYRDNGERVVATPPSYPLVRRRIFGRNSQYVRLLTSAATVLGQA